MNDVTIPDFFLVQSITVTYSYFLSFLKISKEGNKNFGGEDDVAECVKDGDDQE